jgi:hypothetical protein
LSIITIAAADAARARSAKGAAARRHERGELAGTFGGALDTVPVLRVFAGQQAAAEYMLRYYSSVKYALANSNLLPFVVPAGAETTRAPPLAALCRNSFEALSTSEHLLLCACRPTMMPI